MTEFAALRPKINTYLMDDRDESEKANDTKNCAKNLKVIKI